MNDERRHGSDCCCDACEGDHYLAKHIPADALFDGDFEYRGHGAKQRRYQKR